MNFLDIKTIDDFTNEIFETIIDTGALKIERIISCGQTTFEGVWYDQVQDEWVLLIQGNASIEYFDGTIVYLLQGDTLFIPAGKKHRVSFTSSEPPCIWLAVHGNLS